MNVAGLKIMRSSCGRHRRAVLSEPNIVRCRRLRERDDIGELARRVDRIGHIDGDLTGDRTLGLVLFEVEVNLVRTECTDRVELRSSAAVTSVVDIEQGVGIGVGYGAIVAASCSADR